MIFFQRETARRRPWSKKRASRALTFGDYGRRLNRDKVMTMKTKARTQPSGLRGLSIECWRPRKIPNAPGQSGDLKVPSRRERPSALAALVHW